VRQCRWSVLEQRYDLLPERGGQGRRKVLVRRLGHCSDRRLKRPPQQVLAPVCVERREVFADRRPERTAQQPQHLPPARLVQVRERLGQPVRPLRQRARREVLLKRQVQKKQGRVDVSPRAH
jgi:hypothetical protein